MHTHPAEIRGAWLPQVWLPILVLGSLWGFTEVVLGGALNAARVPFRAAILTGLGMGLLAIALASLRRPGVLLPITLIAILCKQLVVPILGVSLSCKANSCLAVGLEGLVLAGTATLIGRRLRSSTTLRVATGASAAAISAATFYWLGLRLAPCPYLLSFARSNGLSAFMRAEALPWASASAILFPAGYWIGGRLTDAASAWRARRPAFYYATSGALVAGSWLASALAIARGL
jgi:hypothetical protein